MAFSDISDIELTFCFMYAYFRCLIVNSMQFQLFFGEEEKLCEHTHRAADCMKLFACSVANLNRGGGRGLRG